MPSKPDRQRDELFSHCSAMAYDDRAGIGGVRQTARTSGFPAPLGASLGAAMSSFSPSELRPSLPGSNRPERDGFLLLSEAIFRSDIPPDIAKQEGMSREEEASAQLEIVLGLNWPYVSEYLMSGLLPTYAFLPDGMLYIDKRHWSLVAQETMPETLNCGLPEPVEPYVRVGAVEWLMTLPDPRPLWTADQTLMWITTRDMGIVQSASPWMGSRRLTWLQFLNSTPFPVMPRVKAMTMLRMDLQFETLAAWNGRRPFDPKLAGPSKWDWAVKDPMAYCALRLGGELHAITMDGAQVQSRYPAKEPSPTPENAEGETSVEEGEHETASRKHSPASIGACFDRIVSEWVAAGSTLNDHPRLRDVQDRMTQELPGLSPNRAKTEWDKRKPVGWDKPGRRPSTANCED